MIATVTRKGQVALPKQVRDRLGIEAGTRLQFRVTDDGRIEVRKVETNPLAIVGILRHLKPGGPVSVERMNDAVLKHAAARDQRTRK